MTRRRVWLFLGVAIFLGGVVTAELILQDHRNAFATFSAKSATQTEVAYRYLRLRELLLKSEDADAIAVAYHVARLPAKSYQIAMKNGGRALSLLNPVIGSRGSTNDPFVIQASYEALILLVRMPWDEELRSWGDRLARILLTRIKAEGKTPNTDELFLVNEALSMYGARKLGELKILEGSLELPDENRTWRNDLATVRIFLTSCIQGAAQDSVQANEALSRGFGLNWLRTKWVEAWDAALIQTVRAATSSNECHRIANRYESMV